MNNDIHPNEMKYVADGLAENTVKNIFLNLFHLTITHYRH